MNSSLLKTLFLGILFFSVRGYGSTGSVDLILTTVKDSSVQVEHLVFDGEMNRDPLSDHFFVLTNEEGKDVTENALGTGFYRALFTTSLVKGRPFKSFHVTLKTIPQANVSSNGAALAIGLLGLAEGAQIPSDVAVLGDLYPDGTLKPIDRIRERLEALLAAGVKRVIIPALQIGVMEQGSLVVLNDIAVKRQASCIPMSTLQDAAKTIWSSMNFPQPAAPQFVAYRVESNFLRAKVATLIQACNSEKEEKGKRMGKMGKRSAATESLYQSADENLETGISAAKTGKYFEAYEQLQTALSQYRVGAIGESDRTYSLPQLQEESKKLIKQFEAFEQAKSLNASVSSAYGYFQTHHSLNLAKGQLLGSENLVRKLVTGRKEPDAASVQKALMAYAIAIEESRIQVRALQDYEILGQVEGAPEMERENENLRYITQLSGRAFMDGGEQFFYRMQKFPQELRPYLLYENGFYIQLTNLLEAKSKDEFIYSLDREIRTRRAENLETVSFTPGAGYIPPEEVSVTVKDDSKKPHPMPALMASLNQISDQALLEFQLTESDAQFDELSKTWQFHRGTDLIMVLDQASKQAELALQLFRESEMPSRVPELIFQRAQIMGSMKSERMKLVALREYWRCTQACFITQVLNYAPPAQRATPQDHEGETLPVQVSLLTPTLEARSLGVTTQ
ncbi:MAG: S16 family serine protease [Verrucomicrobiota bacterium]